MTNDPLKEPRLRKKRRRLGVFASVVLVLAVVPFAVWPPRPWWEIEYERYATVSLVPDRQVRFRVHPLGPHDRYDVAATLTYPTSVKFGRATMIEWSEKGVFLDLRFESDIFDVSPYDPYWERRSNRTNPYFFTTSRENDPYHAGETVGVTFYRAAVAARRPGRGKLRIYARDWDTPLDLDVRATLLPPTRLEVRAFQGATFIGGLVLLLRSRRRS